MMTNVNESVLTILPRDRFCIEHAIIRFRNFAGAPDRFNKGGYSNGFFSVFLTDEQAKTLSDLGYSVRRLRPQEDDPDDNGQALLKVKVGFKYFPEDVYRVTSHSQVALTAETVKGLDHSEIANADITCRPYDWDVNGNKGRTAYLDRGSYFTMAESPFEDKYAKYDEMDA